MASGAGSPCGACKFLRRKCVSDCVFAPYFCFEQASSQFAAIHRIFGASNVSKLLQHLPVPDRGEAVVTIAYEAQARIRDPVYGCVAHIFALQQQVAILQAQLMQVKAQIACNNISSKSHLLLEDQMQNSFTNSVLHPFSNSHWRRPFDCTDHIQISDVPTPQGRDHKEYFANQSTKKGVVAPHELEKLQMMMALKMMKN